MRPKYIHALRRKVAALLLLQRRKKMWVHPINLRRREQGAFHHLIKELHLDKSRFLNYFRMSATQMDLILSFVGEDLKKQRTTWREPIEPKQRLAVTLRYMASGDSMHSLAYSYRLGLETVSTCVEETCWAIEQRMASIYLPKPTGEAWKRIARRFEEKWDFPNCLGSIDGKHINITAPAKSGSLFFNYKGSFSIVLLALVDADYRFTAVQVGEFGRASDGGVYAGSALGKGMADNTLQVPGDAFLPGAEDLGRTPYTMVGDAAFPLKPYLMRPYAGRRLPRRNAIFNYRLSRARMSVEKAFGILASRWRIFYRPIQMKPERVDSLVMAACTLHNMLTSPVDDERWMREAAEPQGGMREIGGDFPNRAGREGVAVRERLANYFISEAGQLDFQDRMVP